MNLYDKPWLQAPSHGWWWYTRCRVGPKKLDAKSNKHGSTLTVEIMVDVWEKIICLYDRIFSLNPFVSNAVVVVEEKTV
jgi:hypothetical protein